MNGGAVPGLENVLADLGDGVTGNFTAESSVASSDRILPATLRSTSRATVIRPPPPGCGAVHGGAADTVSG